MRFILRGAAIGLLAGAAFFFVPFLFRFFLFFLVISFIIRLVWGRGRRYGRHGAGYYNRHFYYNDEMHDDNTISIDGRGYVPPVKGKGTESRISVL